MLDVVCALIENAQGQLLVCKRAASSHLGGQWEFPGGKVEPGEGREDALRREIREELGIVIEVRDALPPVEWDYGATSIRLIPYRCTLVSGIADAHVHDEIRWACADQLEALDMAAADVPILAEWRNGLRPE